LGIEYTASVDREKSRFEGRGFYTSSLIADLRCFAASIWLESSSNSGPTIPPYLGGFVSSFPDMYMSDVPLVAEEQTACYLAGRGK
jgi:hypothetical protein